MARKYTYTKGKKAFLDYYLKMLPHFKDEKALKRHLRLRNAPVLVFAPQKEEELRKLWQEAKLTWKVLEWYPYALCWPKSVVVGETLPGFKEGWIYSLNPASLVPVVAMEVTSGDAILDGCAAPGGKTIAMANLVNMERTLLVANDVSVPRGKRLKTVLKQFGYLHVQVWPYPVQIIQYKQKVFFDKILLDVPCSSEKHVFNSKKHLRIWSAKRITRLAKQQLNMIKAVLPLLKPGGRLVYSTCALNPFENEMVIAEVLEKYTQLHLVRLQFDMRVEPGFGDCGLSEADRMKVVRVSEKGFDPMFVAVMEKR